MMAAKGASPRGQGASWLIKPLAVSRDDLKVRSRQRQKVRSSYKVGRAVYKVGQPQSLAVARSDTGGCSPASLTVRITFP